MNAISTVFFGTERFAATILEGLLNDPQFAIKLVITQPDRPVGRHQEITPTPVKLIAEKYKVPFLQPESLKNFSFEDTFDIGIVAQYGLIIPEHILQAPTHGLVNTHTSLLPKYRGASPIQSALMNGEKETGVTIMQMDKGLDTGPILLQKKIGIAPNDTYELLDVKLATPALEGLKEAVPAFISGTLTPTPQNEAEATMCRPLSRDTGKIVWSETAEHIHNLFRGTYPWPGTWTLWEGKRLKLLQIEITNEKSLKPGEVRVDGTTLAIGTGDGTVHVETLQLEGKKAMDTKTFLTGFRKIHQAVLT